MKLAADSFHNDDYLIRNVFGDGWLSKWYPTNMTLEFEMDNLTKISYCTGQYIIFHVPSSDNNTITVFCDDEQIYSKNTIIPNGTHTSQIHINFNDYDDVNVTYTI